MSRSSTKFTTEPGLENVAPEAVRGGDNDDDFVEIDLGKL